MTAMMFPTLNHIDDVLPHLEGRSDFVVKRGDGYMAIDYAYATADTFSDAFRLECRGIKFDLSGNLIARPFHKFFNVNERPETQQHLIDVAKPHIVTDKLDGSMIHPAIISGELVFMTRMGITDISAKAMRHASSVGSGDVFEFCRRCIDHGLTPIFEYTAPDNRIVVAYRIPSLTLLAVRENHTGRYLDENEIGLPENLTLVGRNIPIKNMASFIATARGLVDAEGYVIRFTDGFMIKIKGDDYVLRHRAKDRIGLEKNALRAVLENADDDLMSVLPEQDADALVKYARDVRAAITILQERVDDLLRATAGIDRKTFAIHHVSSLPLILRPAAFNGYEGKDVRSSIVAFLLKQTGVGSRIDAIRDQAGLPSWNDYCRWTPEE